LTVALPAFSSTLTMVASVEAPFNVTFTLSPAFNSTFAAGLASGSGVLAAGVLAGVFAGLAAFELSVVFGSQAVIANDNSAIARTFFIVSSVSFSLSTVESFCLRR
jgi:hypothetical protein